MTGVPKTIGDLTALPTAPTDGDLVEVERSGESYKADVADLPGSGTMSGADIVAAIDDELGGSTWQGGGGGGGIDNVVEDTTPQLGGNLDLNGHDVPVSSAQQTAINSAQSAAQAYADALVISATGADSVALLGRTISLNSIIPAVLAGAITIASSLTIGDITNPDTGLPYATAQEYQDQLPSRYIDASSAVLTLEPTLDDTPGWIAAQTAHNYALDNWAGADSAIGGGKLTFGGNCYISRKIVQLSCDMEIDGQAPSERFAGPRFVYVGPAGTVDDPECCIEAIYYNNFNVMPRQYGRESTTVVSGVKTFIHGVTFYNGNATGDPISTLGYSNYIQGIRAFAGNGLRIEYCTFAGGLWDGIFSCGPSLWQWFDKNRFYGVERDCISFSPTAHQFSTTAYARENYFGSGGRYAFCWLWFGAIVPMGEIANNIFEQTNSSCYMLNHPEWWVHGATAGSVLMGCDGLHYRGNYYEGVSGWTYSDYALHLADAGGVVIDDRGSPILWTQSASQPRSDALIEYTGRLYNCTAITVGANATFTTSQDNNMQVGDRFTCWRMHGMTQLEGVEGEVTSITSSKIFVTDIDTTGFSALTSAPSQNNVTRGRLYGDVTNLRNFSVSGIGDFQPGGKARCHFRACDIRLFMADVVNFDNTDVTYFSEGTVEMWALATKQHPDDPAMRIVTTLDEARCFPSGFLSAGSDQVVLTAMNYDSRRWTSYDPIVGNGAYKISSAGNPAAWSAGATINHNFGENYLRNVQSERSPTAYNGYCYIAMKDGTTHASVEPTWLGPQAHTYITAITPGTTTVITASGHDLSNDQYIWLDSMHGASQGNAEMYKVANVSGTQFEIKTIAGAAVNSSGWDTYLKGGYVCRVNNDNGVPWMFSRTIFDSTENNVPEWLEANKRRRGDLNSVPTTGKWAVGAKVYFNDPHDAGFEGSVVSVAGVGVGVTWKTFGAVTA